MAKDNSLHQYSHVLANLLRAGKQGALPELYAGIVDELKQSIRPEQDDILLLLETMGAPNVSAGKQTEQEVVIELIKAIMVLLEQDDFQQGAKSYHLNLLKRAPTNALERRLKTLNFVDALKLITKS